MLDFIYVWLKGWKTFEWRLSVLKRYDDYFQNLPYIDSSGRKSVSSLARVIWLIQKHYTYVNQITDLDFSWSNKSAVVVFNFFIAKPELISYIVIEA